MLRSAIEILNDVGVDTGSPRHEKAIIKAINKARLECIRECADEATRMWNKGEFDKQKLLSLINEVI